mmetsp:Transcript_20375/g.38483  ORF Transcript_20375/g.38483 Transcript_20375/m.38483 type:complete len:180 (+) Transcript_20375:1398-1937(+)
MTNRSTTSAQLRAATVRGAISAFEEQADIARGGGGGARRKKKKSIIHHHVTEEAISVGNIDVLICNTRDYEDDLGHPGPPCCGSPTDSSGGSSSFSSATSSTTGSTSTTSASSKIVRSMSIPHSAVMSIVNGNRNNNGSTKIRMPRDGIQSMRRSISVRRRSSSTKKPVMVVDKNGSFA